MGRQRQRQHVSACVAVCLVSLRKHCPFATKKPIPSYSIAEKVAASIRTSAKVDTRKLRPHELACLAQLVLNVELVEASKPTAADGEVVTTSKSGKDGLALVNARFKSRVRKSSKVYHHSAWYATRSLTAYIMPRLSSRLTGKRAHAL